MDMAYFIALHFAKNMALLPLEEPKKCTRDGYDIFHSFALFKKYALLPLGEPKIGTENELAPRARKTKWFQSGHCVRSAAHHKEGTTTRVASATA